MNNHNTVSKKAGTILAIFTLVALALALQAQAPAAEEAEPVKTVRAFYQAIADKNCDLALAYRPGYKKSRCATITQPKVKRVEVQYNEDGVAVCSLDITYRESGMPSVWTGFVKVVNQGTSWAITEDYRSDIRLEQYLAEVIKVQPKPEDGSTAAPPATPPAGSTADAEAHPVPGSSPAEIPDYEAGATAGPDTPPAAPAAPELDNGDLYYNYRAETAAGATAPAGEEDGTGPTAVVRRYFKAAGERNVEAACALRADCSDKIKDEIKNNRGGKIETVEEKSNDGAQAVVYVEIMQMSLDGGSVRWKQDVTLKNTGAGWKISYYSPAAYEAEAPKPEAGASPDAVPDAVPDANPDANPDTGPDTGPGAEAEQVMKDYYKALNDHDVEAACRFRVVCDERVKTMVQNHKRIEIEAARLKTGGDKTATVYTESVETGEDGKRIRWKQDWKLKMVGGKWLIEKTENWTHEELP